MVLSVFGQVVTSNLVSEVAFLESEPVGEIPKIGNIDDISSDESSGHRGGLERGGDEPSKSNPGLGTTVTEITSSPTLEETSASYVYKTDYGVYEFSKKYPVALSLSNPAGDVLVDESRFFVSSDIVLTEENPRVLTVSESQISAQVDMVSESGHLEGILTVVTEYRKAAPPKITAHLRKSYDSEIGTFSIEWRVTTDNSYLSSQDAPIGEFSLASGLKAISLARNWVRLSPSDDGKDTTRNVIVDWRDFPSGDLYAGEDKSTEKFQVIVRFPTNVAYVDPTVIVENVPSYSLGQSIQRRNSFHTDGYYWVFHRNSGRVYYQKSHDGFGWSDPTDVGTLNSVQDFEVIQSGLDVAICYTAPDKIERFSVRTGHITTTGDIEWVHEHGLRVDWQWPFFITTLGYCSITRASDGYYYVALASAHTGPTGIEYKARVFVSVDGGQNFVENGWYLEDYSGNPFDYFLYVTVTAMTNRKVALVWSEYDDSGLYWAIKDSDIWGDQNHCFVGMQIAQPRNFLLSVVASDDDQLHVAYVKQDVGNSEYSIGHATLAGSTCATELVRTYSSSTPNLYWPTVSVDREGILHVFYREDVGSTYNIHYAREKPNPGGQTGVDRWFDSIPFGSLTSYQGKLSAPEHFGNRAYLIWEEEISDPDYRIKFGSFPVLAELSSSPGQPWSAQGLSPYQEFFANYGQMASPGNGQLTVYQTDVALKGRGLDIAVSRIHMPTRLYGGGFSVEEESPYDVCGGWKYDFPWVGERYLHLWGGQQYQIKWIEDVFENHEGEHFKLVRETSPSLSYTLYAKDGLTYSFDDDGRLTKIEDMTDWNYITLLYLTSTKIDKIIDTIGRQIQFFWNVHGPDHITYEGRTIQYGYLYYYGAVRLVTVSDPL
ncbi:MAG: hypothetical protein ACE5IO_07260, partial [Thermoplasmata archaeon]